MPDQIGPHLLGRIYAPDDRDYAMSDYLGIAPPTDDIKSMTIQQVHDTTEYFSSWRGLLVFWHWAKTGFGPAPGPPSPATAVVWEDKIQLDQGNTGHCVGFGWAGWGDAAPVEDTFQDADAHAIYYEAKVIDGQPKQENGSSVRSGAKAMQNRGRLTTYFFASSVDEVTQWVLNHGPVVCGTDWTDDMFNPDSNGLIQPTGSVAGGHCYLMLGYDPATGLFTFQNSWGSSWGQSGRFHMHDSDFAKLLSQQGEACAALESPKP